MVIRIDAVGEYVPGGYAEFSELLADHSPCADEELRAVGFSLPEEAQGFVRELQHLELVYLDQDGEAVDFVAVDEEAGPEIPFDGLEFGQIEIGVATPSAAWFWSDPDAAEDEQVPPDMELATPEGWEPLSPRRKAAPGGAAFPIQVVINFSASASAS